MTPTKIWLQHYLCKVALKSPDFNAELLRQLLDEDSALTVEEQVQEDRDIAIQLVVRFYERCS